MTYYALNKTLVVDLRGWFLVGRKIDAEMST